MIDEVNVPCDMVFIALPEVPCGTPGTALPWMGLSTWDGEAKQDWLPFLIANIQVGPGRQPGMEEKNE